MTKTYFVKVWFNKYNKKLIVDERKCADLMLKILNYAQNRLSRDDFGALLRELKRLELGSDDIEQLGVRIAHACRLNPEIMGLLCAVLPGKKLNHLFRLFF